MSSDVLLAIAMFLCPLNLTAATRLFNLAGGAGWLVSISLLAAAAVIAGIYFMAVLAGGLMDRSLSARHAQLFVALAAVQMLAPWIGLAQSWHWLAAAHLIVLGLLGYGLFVFSNNWVRSIFIDRQRLSYYAAGLLVFAGVVSFVHLTWAFPHTLPRGYSAPFLMALGGLFFCGCGAEGLGPSTRPICRDLRFALYGVSIVALLLSWQTDLPQLLTLILGALIYGFVLFRYLTPPPLYLLLGCLGWLYASLVLGVLPREWHLLASLPALGGLFWAARWMAPRAPSLSRICLLVLPTGFIALTGLVGLTTELAGIFVISDGCCFCSICRTLLAERKWMA